jgi:hypothetical protein
MISRSQMNRQLYNMGGEGIMQVAPQQDSMPSDMQGEQYRPVAENLANDPKQAIEVIVKMLMEQGIPEEEARRIAMEMIQTVAQTGSLEEFEEDERVEARFGGRIGYAGGGISNIAIARETLQSRAPEGEFLAYINPEEASILKSLGGAGRDINQTGIPSFFVKKVFKAAKSVVKGAANAVKSVAKSPIGRIALTIGATYALGGIPALSGSSFAAGAMRAGLANLAVQAVSGQGINLKEGLIAAGLGGLTSSMSAGTGTEASGAGATNFAPDPFQEAALGNPTVSAFEPSAFAPDPFQAAATPAADAYANIAAETAYTPSVFDTSAQASITGGPGITFEADPFQASAGASVPTSDFSDYFNSFEDIKSPTYQQGKFGQTIGVEVGNEGVVYKPGQVGFAETPLSQRYETGIQALKDYRPMDALKQIFGVAMDYPATSIGLASLASTAAVPEPPKPEDFPSNEAYLAAVAEYERMYASNLAGTSTTLPSSANNPFYATTTYAANGGRIGYAYGSVDEGIMAAPQIANMMGMPVGNPRQNQQGVSELDYRDQGGFVPPIGVKERADDIPAMLSNNEFVFTADAVKNAGGGDPNIGAQKMYTLMKRLESGGMV